MDFVIPVALELGPPKTHAGKLVVFDLGSGWIRAGIEFCMNLQALRSGRGGDEIDDHFEAQERLSAPVLTDEAEQSVFDFVPLACAWRKVANGDSQARFIGQLL